ncbi:hypothetical protein B296_00019046, partial [Ensete ventricosum]
LTKITAIPRILARTVVLVSLEKGKVRAAGFYGRADTTKAAITALGGLPAG